MVFGSRCAADLGEGSIRVLKESNAVKPTVWSKRGLGACFSGLALLNASTSSGRNLNERDRKFLSQEVPTWEDVHSHPQFHDFIMATYDASNPTGDTAQVPCG